MTESSRFRTRLVPALGAVALLTVGGGIGSAVTHAVQRPLIMAPTAPVPIASLATMTEPAFGTRIVTVRGRVAEIYGGRFVLADAGGRALVEAGRPDADQPLVTLNQPLLVQGRFDDGVLRAAFLVDADGSVTAVGGPHGRHGHHRGPHDDDRGPRDVPRTSPPAPPAAGA